MRLLHVIRSVNPAGGGPIEGVKQIAAVMQSLQHQIEVACLDAPGEPWAKDFPLPLYPFRPLVAYGYSPELVPWLRAHASQYQVVIVNGIWNYASLGVWRALRRSPVPYVVFTHGMLDPWFKHYYPLKHLKKWLYWPWAEYRVLRDARAVLFTCEEERRLARQSFWLYRCTERVVNYGTAGPAGDAARQKKLFLDGFPELCGKRLVLFLGRLHEKKGCDLLLRAFAARVHQHPDWHLVMAGPDQAGWRPQLEALGGALGLAGRVTWPGSLSGDLKWGAFHAAEVFVLPSHQENFGIAVAEALACGVPALISNKVNIWREVQDDGAGLVESDDATGTCRLLERWLNLDKPARQAMRQRARTCFETRFEIRKAAANLLETFRSLNIAA